MAVCGTTVSSAEGCLLSLRPRAVRYWEARGALCLANPSTKQLTSVEAVTWATPTLLMNTKSDYFPCSLPLFNIFSVVLEGATGSLVSFVWRDMIPCACGGRLRAGDRGERP